MNTKQEARRWYQISVIFCCIAVVAAILSSTGTRIGYPLSFICTMMGIVALNLPKWNVKQARVQMLTIDGVALIIESSILYFGLVLAHGA